MLRLLRLVALPAAAAAVVAGCATLPYEDEDEDPNAGMLRDFLDGKFDSAGHPLNAKVIDAAGACAGEPRDGGVALAGACELAVPDGARTGELTVNARLRVRGHAVRGAIVDVELVDAGGATLAAQRLTVARLRGRDAWIDLAVALGGAGTVATVRVAPAAGALVELDYVEVFPRKFGLVVSPGSGVVGDADDLAIELPRARKLERLTADGEDVLPRLDALLADGIATRTTTAFRTLIEVPVGALLPARGDVTELQVRTVNDAARVQLRRAPLPCVYEGDPAGARVLVTGFQPFPADGWHDNVSAIAVTALDPGALRGAQVMRAVFPVEYDRAAAAMADAIARCRPDAVVSFGQGGGAIALEEVAYNLQDTGEIAGGVPDNRGIIRAAAAIDPAAAPTRASRLPLDDIDAALVALGERPRRSRDPGRYICNNVMFSNLGALPAGAPAGFIHLPYTVSFDDATRARYGRIATAAVQATVDAR